MKQHDAVTGPAENSRMGLSKVAQCCKVSPSIFIKIIARLKERAVYDGKLERQFQMSKSAPYGNKNEWSAEKRGPVEIAG